MVRTCNTFLERFRSGLNQKLHQCSLSIWFPIPSSDLEIASVNGTLELDTEKLSNLRAFTFLFLDMLF